MQCTKNILQYFQSLRSWMVGEAGRMRRCRESKKWVKVEVGKIYFITNFCRNISLNSHLRLKLNVMEWEVYYSQNKLGKSFQLKFKCDCSVFSSQTRSMVTFTASHVMFVFEQRFFLMAIPDLIFWPNFCIFQLVVFSQHFCLSVFPLQDMVYWLWEPGSSISFSKPTQLYPKCSIIA